jgi:hypothetical protein
MMFFNPTGGFFALLFLSVVLILMTFAAHVIWVARFALSPALSERLRLEQAAILFASFVMPVISFYVVHITCWWRRHEGRVHLGMFRPLGFAILATFAVVAFGVTLLLMRSSPDTSDWRDIPGIFFEQSLFLAVPQLLLFMIFRSFAPGWRNAHVVSVVAVLFPLFILLLAG